jgi:MoaA/NifB/PqqE/SkfB family radical SAM enzyme
MHGSRAFGGPFRVSFALTDRCNIRCMHCYFHSPLGQNRNFFPVRRASLNDQHPVEPGNAGCRQRPDADAKRVAGLLDEAISMGTRRFQFTGNGEPLLFPQIPELVQRVKRAGCLCRIYTNATLLDHGTVDHLIRIGVDRLVITTLAGAEEMYARTRPSSPANEFSRIRDGLVYLKERKRELGVARPRVVMACTVFAANIEGLLDVARFSHRVGASLLQFRPMDDVRDAGLARLVPSEKDAEKARRILEEARTYLDGVGLRHNIDRFLGVFSRRLCTADLVQSIRCYYGWLVPLIDVDGMVYPCCRCYEPLGNIHELSFRDVWHGTPYREFRRRALASVNCPEPLENCDCFSCPNYVPNQCLHGLLGPLVSLTENLFRRS